MGSNHNSKVCYKKEGLSTKEADNAPPEFAKLASEYSQCGATGVVWQWVPVVAIDNSTSDAFRNLEKLNRLSTKDVPNTAKRLAYTASLNVNNAGQCVYRCFTLLGCKVILRQAQH